MKPISKLYMAATPTGDTVNLIIRPPLERGYLRTAKLALRASETQPKGETPAEDKVPPEDETLLPTVWRAISATGESRLQQNNITHDMLNQAGSVLLDALRAEGLEIMPVGGIHISETGLLEI